MTEIDKEEKSLTLEGRIADRFPVLSRLDEAIREAEIAKLAAIMRMYLTADAQADADNNGWAMVNQFLTEREGYHDQKTRRRISPWKAAAIGMRNRYGDIIGKAPLRFDTGMQDVFLAEKEGITIELLDARRRAANKPSSRRGAIEGEVVGRGMIVGRILSGRLTNRGR